MKIDRTVVIVILFALLGGAIWYFNRRKTATNGNGMTVAIPTNGNGTPATGATVVAMRIAESTYPVSVKTSLGGYSRALAEKTPDESAANLFAGAVWLYQEALKQGKETIKLDPVVTDKIYQGMDTAKFAQDSLQKWYLYATNRYTLGVGEQV